MISSPRLLPVEQIQLMARAELERRRRAGPQPAQFLDDPVGFGRTFLNERYTADVERMMLSVRDYPVTIAESANAVGKSHGAARVAVWWFQRPGAQVWMTSAPPESNLKSILWAEIGEIVTKAPELFLDCFINNLRIKRLQGVGRTRQQRVRESKEFIAGVAIPRDASPQSIEARFGGKHAPALLFILDEADAIPAAVFRAIESCLSGGKGRLLCLYNPRSEGGPVGDLIAKGARVVRISALSHPNVTTGEDIIPGAVTRSKTLTRIHRWTTPVDKAEGIAGFGRWSPPDFLVGATGADETSGEKLPPLGAGERIIIDAQFSYAVLGEYPGAHPDMVYDVWLDDYDLAAARGESPRGNVQDSADYILNGGTVLWAMDDGYAGQIDPETGHYTADSHPRVIGLYQYRPNGTLCRFAELYRVQEPQASRQITESAEMGHPAPAFVAIGPGSEQLGGTLSEMGYYKRTCGEKVAETIKHLRGWVAADNNGVRRFLVHPRCRHFRYEMRNYAKDPRTQTPKKCHDHGPDEARYLAWILRNGL